MKRRIATAVIASMVIATLMSGCGKSAEEAADKAGKAISEAAEYSSNASEASSRRNDHIDAIDQVVSEIDESVKATTTTSAEKSNSNQDGIPEDLLDFCQFAEQKLGAKKVNWDDPLSKDQWDKGFYYVTDERSTFFRLSYAGKFLSDSGLDWGPIDWQGATLKDYSSYNIAYYVKGKENPWNVIETFDFQKDGQTITQNREDRTVSNTGLVCISFSSESDSLSYFKSFIERYFDEQVEKDYRDKLQNAIEGIRDTLENKNYEWINSKAEVADRSVYTSAELPNNIFYLDESTCTGHLSGKLNYEEANIRGVVSSWAKPEYIWLNFMKGVFSVELKGNKVYFLYDQNLYQQNGCRTFYYEDWPKAEMPNSALTQAFCEEFGLVNPFTISQDDDIEQEFAYVYSQIGRGIAFKEVYLRKS